MATHPSGLTTKMAVAFCPGVERNGIFRRATNGGSSQKVISLEEIKGKGFWPSAVANPTFIAT